MLTVDAEILAEAKATLEEVELKWSKRVLSVLKEALPELAHEQLHDVALLVMAGLSSGRENAFSYPDLRIAEHGKLPGLSESNLTVVSLAELTYLANLLQQIESGDQSTLTRLIGKARKEGFRSLTIEDLKVPKDYEASTYETDEAISTALRANELFRTDRRAVHALLDNLFPDSQVVLLNSSGKEILARALSREFEPEQVHRAEEWFLSIAGAINPSIDFNKVRGDIATWSEDDFDGNLGFAVGVYGAGLLDEAAAWGQFDLVHAFRRGFGMLSIGLDDSLNRWIGEAPGPGRYSLNIAENSPVTLLSEAVKEAVDKNSNYFFDELGRNSLFNEGMALRLAMSEGFGTTDLFAPGRSALTSQMAMQGINLSRARVKLATDLHGAGYRMRGDEGVFPIATQTELNLRKVVNAANFSREMGKATYEFSTGTKTASVLAYAGQYILAVPVAAYTAMKTYDIIQNASQVAVSESKAIARDQERLNAYNDAFEHLDNITTPSTTPDDSKEKKPVDPEHLGPSKNVPISVVLNQFRNDYLSVINIHPDHYNQDHWISDKLAFQELIVAISSLIYPPNPYLHEETEKGKSGGTNFDNKLVSDPPIETD